MHLRRYEHLRRSMKKFFALSVGLLLQLRNQLVMVENFVFIDFNLMGLPIAGKDKHVLFGIKILYDL